MLKKFAIAMVCLAVFAIVPANADEWNKKTTITFTQPVEIPGTVLQPGTYVFKLLNSDTNRNIVLVYNAEENHLFAMILAIPNYRLNPTGEPVLRFSERAKNAPDALRAWFYSNSNWGQEFVYPKAVATQLAETAKVPVLTAEITPTETVEQLIETPVVEITPEAAEIEIAQVPAPAERVVHAPVLIAEEPAPSVAEELPHTESWLPLWIFLGLAILGFAYLMKATSKKT